MHILAPYLDEILVIWVNTGAAYESTLKQMGQIRNTVPHFFEVTTNQPGDIEKWGWPTDILPIRHDSLLFGKLQPKLQTAISCCAKNIWLPTQLCLKDKGINLCYIGAREDESMSDSRWDGTRDGIEFKYPLRKWTVQMVQDYVKKHNIMLPPYYYSGPNGTGEEKSRDCWSCTGYLWERRASIAALPFYQRQEVINRLNTIRETVNNEIMINIEIIDVKL